MLNYLPIVHKAFVYVPKVMRKPVMGGNTVSETFVHMFRSADCTLCCTRCRCSAEGAVLSVNPLVYLGTMGR